MLAALFASADATAAPWRCAAADTPALKDEQLVIGDGTWQLGGHALKRSDPDPEIVIGVVADAAGAAPRTIAALGRLRAAFDAAKPDLVLALGGMGATQEELVATLGTLGDRASWPVVALPGDLEPVSAYLGALAALRQRGDTVLDARSVRWIELPGVTIGTLPGAGASERLVAGSDGCSWRAEDIAALYSELTARSGLRIVATAEAPRVQVAGEPAGELALVPSRAQPIELVLHGPVEPTPSRARTGGRDGANVLLTPGTADATPRLPRAHEPASGVLVVRGTAWAWRPLVDAP